LRGLEMKLLNSLKNVPKEAEFLDGYCGEDTIYVYYWYDGEIYMVCDRWGNNPIETMFTHLIG